MLSQLLLGLNPFNLNSDANFKDCLAHFNVYLNKMSLTDDVEKIIILLDNLEGQPLGMDHVIPNRASLSFCKFCKKGWPLD